MRVAVGVALLSLCTGLFVPVQAGADLTVKYRATDSRLTLFNQPQEAPFRQVAYTLYLHGTKVRTEFVDALGRAWWFVADRAAGTAYGLDPAKKTYWQEAGAWGCDHLPDQVGRALAGMMRQAGIEKLAVAKGGSAPVGSVETSSVTVQFSGRVLGTPQPVATDLVLYFPPDEAATFGPHSGEDLYCGKKPTPAAWSTMLQQWLRVDEAMAGRLGEIMTLPLRITLAANLGIGTAALTLDAVEISHAAIDQQMFAIPSDFTPRGGDQ